MHATQQQTFSWILKIKKELGFGLMERMGLGSLDRGACGTKGRAVKAEGVREHGGPWGASGEHRLQTGSLQA